MSTSPHGDTLPTGPALDAFLARYVRTYEAAFGTAPQSIHDPAWPSPCEVGLPGDDGRIAWTPVRRREAPDFSGLERALECPVHSDLKTYFGRYYADVVHGHTEEGGLSLIQVWNDADFDRLVENTLGHVLAKRRARQPLTLFFATTDEEEYFLSVDNASGQVLLESPGQAPVRTVASDLASLLSRIEPVAKPPEESI